MSEPSVIEHPAACYTVRNGWAWAHLFVRHGVADEPGGRRGWVHVAVISDYGSFGYCWSHIGAAPWREFLAGLDMHYAMQKMMGPQFTVPMTVSEAEDQARRLVIDDRRQRGIDLAEARQLWDAIDAAGSTDDAHHFFRQWDDQSGGLAYRREYWDSRWTKTNPQAEGFWQDVWPHFTAAIITDAGRAALAEA